MTGQILALREHLLAQQVSCVVLEATSDCWNPFYYLLEDAGFEVWSTRRHVKNLGTYLGARYRRITSRRGPQEANVAIQHSMLTEIWHIGTP